MSVGVLDRTADPAVEDQSRDGLEGLEPGLA